MARKYILDAETVNMKLQRMAFEIVENNLDEQKIFFIGIQENGSVIARNMAAILRGIGTFTVELVNLSLDKKHPVEVTLDSAHDLNGQVIIIVDDVASSGKTLLYALKPFLSFYPKKIQTLALVERTHKLFPVNLDYKGLSVATTVQEHIYVEVEGEKVTGAYLE